MIDKIINHFKKIPPKRLLDYWNIFLISVLVAVIIAVYT